MPIDYALILSAGLGTRMGELGKVIPKVLWPIYFKTILELQIRYCEDLGVKKIYINTHFLHEEIITFLNKAHLSGRVTVLHEPILLDSGGAIHNMASRSEVNYQGNLLLVNGDQYLFFDDYFWTEAKKIIKSTRAVLFGIKVDKASTYNETVVKGNRLVDIIPNTKKLNDYITYSGLGLLNLTNLKPAPGVSRFFETVANYKHEEVVLLTPDLFEYWDFGTAGIYKKNIFRLTSSAMRNSLMGKFLSKHQAFRGDDKIFIDQTLTALDLELSGNFIANTIQAKGIIQKV